MRIVIVGAGVIGRIYAARLCRAGCEVTVVARGSAAQALIESGVSIRVAGGSMITVFPSVVTEMGSADEADLAIVAVRRDQIGAASSDVARLNARIVVSLCDLPMGLADLAILIGFQRFVPAFPGVGGCIGDDGVVEFIDVRQQPTTIQDGPVSMEVAGVLESAGFRTTIVPDLTPWLQSHAVFICAFESAIVAADGDLAALASNRRAVRNIVLGVREGMRALEARAVEVVPRSLRMIFLGMPVWFATRYWMRQLSGPLGRLGFLPHSMASRDTELPALQRDVRALTNAASTPMLERLFDSVRP